MWNGLAEGINVTVKALQATLDLLQAINSIGTPDFFKNMGDFNTSGGNVLTQASQNPIGALFSTIIIGAAIKRISRLGKAVGKILNPLSTFTRGSRAATTQAGRFSKGIWKMGSPLDMFDAKLGRLRDVLYNKIAGAFVRAYAKLAVFNSRIIAVAKTIGSLLLNQFIRLARFTTARLLVSLARIGPALASAFAGGPVTIAIAAIGALIAGGILLWTTNLFGFRDAVKGIWSNIKTGFVAAWEGVKTWWSNNMTPWLNTIFERLGNVFSGATNLAGRDNADVRQAAIDAGYIPDPGVNPNLNVRTSGLTAEQRDLVTGQLNSRVQGFTASTSDGGQTITSEEAKQLTAMLATLTSSYRDLNNQPIVIKLDGQVLAKAMRGQERSRVQLTGGSSGGR